MSSHPVSVFASAHDDLYAVYNCELALRSKLMGGAPRNPKVIEGWLRSKAGVDDALEVQAMLLRHLKEMGVEVAADASYDEIVAASGELADTHTSGFKRNGAGLYIEGRQVKAMIKECTNILFAGERWGKREKGHARGSYSGKGPKSFVAEHVFVQPDEILLGRDEPDGIETIVGHVTLPDGRPQATLGYNEYVEKVTVQFEVLVAEDAVTPEQWARIWTLAERNGLGAMRSQGYGPFVVTRWERKREE